MTPEAQRIAIAEACGLEVTARGKRCEPYHGDTPIPDYLGDLNAMHELARSRNSSPFRRVLAGRFPGVPNVGDVRQRANFAQFAGGVDVLTGGFPCQPWSVAGQQRGADDDRHLWPAMCDVIETVRPAWIIGENVPGLISLGLDSVFTDLESLGYAAQPFIVPACAVDARHRRDRVWVVAHAHGPRPQGRNGEELRERASERAAGARGASLANAASFDGGEQDGHRQIPIGGGGFGRSLPEPGVGRVAHGVSHRAHRLRGLGNSIVPQVAEQFFHFIAQIESEKQNAPDLRIRGAQKRKQTTGHP